MSAGLYCCVQMIFGLCGNSCGKEKPPEYRYSLYAAPCRQPPSAPATSSIHLYSKVRRRRRRRRWSTTSITPSGSIACRLRVSLKHSATEEETFCREPSMGRLVERTICPFPRVSIQGSRWEPSCSAGLGHVLLRARVRVWRVPGCFWTGGATRGWMRVACCSRTSRV